MNLLHRIILPNVFKLSKDLGSISASILSAPMKTTVSDMWQMVWETGCNKIVMFAEMDDEGKVPMQFIPCSILYFCY